MNKSTQNGSDAGGGFPLAPTSLEGRGRMARTTPPPCAPLWPSILFLLSVALIAGVLTYGGWGGWF